MWPIISGRHPCGVERRSDFENHPCLNTVAVYRYIKMQSDTDYRYLRKISDVRGGNVVVAATRIGVHDVVGLIINGDSVDDVVRSFPDLKRSQVYECLAYYEDHRGEIDALIARQMSDQL